MTNLGSVVRVLKQEHDRLTVSVRATTRLTDWIRSRPDFALDQQILRPPVYESSSLRSGRTTTGQPVILSPREASTDATDLVPSTPDINDFRMAAKTERLL